MGFEGAVVVVAVVGVVDVVDVAAAGADVGIRCTSGPELH